MLHNGNEPYTKSNASELDEANTVRIWRSQLTVLEDQAAKAEVAEVERARVEAELQQAKSAAQRVDALEQENKNLRQQLESLLQKQRLPPIDVPTSGTLQGSTPVPNPAAAVYTTTPSEQRKVNTKTVPGEVYNVLARKYNELAENWKHEKKKKEQHIEKYEKSKSILAGWQQLAEKKDRQLQRRDAIIEKLKRGGPQHEVQDLSIVTQEPANASQNLSIPGPAGERRSWPHIPLSSSIPVAPGDTSDSSLVLPRQTVEAPQRAVPSLSTTTTMDIPSDPPESCAPVNQIVKSRAERSNVLAIQDSDEDDEPDSPLLLPSLPVSRVSSIVVQAHSSGTTDEDALTKLDAIVDKEILPHSMSLPKSDSPEIVSIKRVGKRRNQQESQSRTPRKRIKVEITSSPTGMARLVNSSDSLDLDDIGQKTDTPRKEKRIHDLARGRRALSDDTDSPRTDSQRRELNHLRAVSEQITEETPTRQVFVGRKISALQPKSVNQQVFPRNVSNLSTKKSRKTSDRDIGNLIEGGEVSIPVIRTSETAFVPDGKLQHLLDKSSPAKVILGPVRVKSPLHPSHGRSLNGRLAVFNDEDADRGLQGGSGLTNRETLKPVSKADRYDNIATETPTLATPVIETPRIAFSTRPTTWDVPSLPRKAKSDNIKPQKIIWDVTTPTVPRSVPKNSSSTARKAAQRPPRKVQTETEWQHDPDQEPLRLRPVESLRLDDFKVNPAYNQGYNFAFREVVRDKDSRQELQGCVKPGCCLEKFQAMATAERNPNVPPTQAQKEADEELLEEYLGDNVYKLRTMDQTEKDALVLQARIRKISNQHGKHRHAYERPSTPPGFWRADFATTQEEAADRAQASQDLKMQVRQRYEEAMRGNGRYVFRDE